MAAIIRDPSRRFGQHSQLSNKLQRFDFGKQRVRLEQLRIVKQRPFAPIPLQSNQLYTDADRGRHHAPFSTPEHNQSQQQLSGAESESGHVQTQALSDPDCIAIAQLVRVQLCDHTARARRRVHSSRSALEHRHVNAEIRLPLERLDFVRQLLGAGL